MIDERAEPGFARDRRAAKLEPSLADAAAGDAVQFERLGYFCADDNDDTAERRCSTAS